MINFTTFINDAMNENYKLYGSDGGEFRLINYCLISEGEQPITAIQHKVVANITRGRNAHLKREENHHHDLRTKTLPNHNQLNFFDTLYPEDVQQIKAAYKYYVNNPERLNQANSKTKKGIRVDIDNNHIEATKMLFPLLIHKPIVRLTA